MSMAKTHKTKIDLNTLWVYITFSFFFFGDQASLAWVNAVTLVRLLIERVNAKTFQFHPHSIGVVTVAGQ